MISMKLNAANEGRDEGTDEEVDHFDQTCD
jgi:hypothetical protein